MQLPIGVSAAVASGVIAGLASYVIIHLPFWLWDLVNKKLLKRGENQRRWGRTQQTASTLYPTCFSAGLSHDTVPSCIAD